MRQGAVFDAGALVACLDDVAMMGEAVEERGGHLGHDISVACLAKYTTLGGADGLSADLI